MASMIRPSLILNMHIDDREYSEDLKAEIRRSYSYVSPSMVDTQEVDDEYVENVLRFLIRLRRKYWDPSDPEAKEQWDGVMPKWLHNMFNKVSNTMVASNKIRRNDGKRPLIYNWIELEFDDNAVMAIKSGANSAIPAEAEEFVEKARTLMTSGGFGDGEIACIRMPSRAYYQAQLAEKVEELKAAEAAAAAEAAEKAAAEAAETAEGEAAADAQPADAAAEGAQQVADATAVVAEAATEEVAAAPEGAEAESTVSATMTVPVAEGEEAEVEVEAEVETEPEKPLTPLAPDFDADYSIWGIEYADGTIREFDSEANTFL